MAAPDDKSWTIAPTLLWFTAILGGAVWAFDGDLSAFADRLTTKRETTPGAAGPTFTAKPAVVADADDGAGNDGKVQPKPEPIVVVDRSHVGELHDVCLDGTAAACKQWGLDAFYKSITDTKAKKLGRALRVSWYGDSVVATDAIPGHLRLRMQADLGDGGPGFVFAIPPHRFVAHEAITRGSSGEWLTHAISTTIAPDGLYGPGGSSAETSGGGTTSIKLVAGTVDKLELYYLGQPKGGSVTISADGTQLDKVDTAADAKTAKWALEKIAKGASSFKVETAGRVRLFGIDLEKSTGAVVDNLGIVSVNVKSFNNHDRDAWIAQLAHRDADLVMIMIGANEAQWLGPADQDTKAYAANYEKILTAIRKGRPDGSCLVVSPTDQAEAKDGAYPSRPVMPVLVAAQRKAAEAAGCAFFSTYDWMGAKGSAAKWFAKGFVGSDFQHLSRKGANKMADAVYDVLMAGYAKYAGH